MNFSKGRMRSFLWFRAYPSALGIEISTNGLLLSTKL